MEKILTKRQKREATKCLSDYGRSVMNATRSYKFFQFNPYSNGVKANNMARILLSNGYLKIQDRVKPGLWRLVLTDKGVEALRTRVE